MRKIRVVKMMCSLYLKGNLSVMNSHNFSVVPPDSFGVLADQKSAFR